MFLPFFAKAQLSPVNDTVRVSGQGAAYTPAASFGFYGGDFISYMRRATSNKWDFYPTGAYLRKYYTFGGGSFGAKIDSLKAANNIWTGTTNTFNGTVQVNGNFNMTGNADITGELRSTSLVSGSSTTNNLHVGTGVGGAYIDFISSGPFPYPYNWRIGNNVGGLDDYFYIRYRNAETVKIDTFNRVFIDTLKDNSGRYYLKSDSKIVAGDSTRNGIFTVVGSSVTKGPPNGVTYNDSTYLVKYSNLQGMRINNYGLSGRALQQITVGDSSAYSKRLLTPTYTTGSYIGCECLINDAQRDSTVYTIATYTTQLTAWVDAQIAAGYPANHILLFNAAYFNNPAAATYPFVENRHDQYAAAMLAVATAKGTLFYDGYYTFKTLYTATPSLLDASVLHPTDAGTTIVANALYDYLKTYIPTISDANSKLLISGSGESYFNFTVGNYLKFKNTPSPLLPNSTQPLLAYDAADKRVKTKTIYPVDVYNIWGVPGNTGVNDFNDASNAKPGFAGTLLTGNSAPNGPTTNSGSYQVQTVDYSGTTTHTGAGNVTQLAWPYTSATSQTNGFWYRGRTSGNVFSSWIHLMGSSALSGAGQIPIGQTGGVYTNTTLTGVIAVDAAGATTFAASPTFTGANLTLNNSSTGTTQIISTNTNAGTAADARLTASNGTVSFGTIIRGTGFTSNANNGFLNLTGTGSIGFLLNSTERLRMLTSGNTGWGVTTPTAQIHIKAGTATAGTAPIKLTAGTNLTAVEAGAIEFDGTRYYASTTGVRNTVAYLTDAPTLLQLSASGNGSSTTISIAHGLTGISATSKVIVQPINAASAGISYITSDATNINIVYTVAPASGTNNLTYNFSIKP